MAETVELKITIETAPIQSLDVGAHILKITDWLMSNNYNVKSLKAQNIVSFSLPTKGAPSSDRSL